MCKLKAILCILLCFSGLFTGILSADAAEALPPGMVIGDSDGIYATPDGEYYVDLVDILPGETYEKEITIRSLDLEEPFSLGMLVEERDSTGSVDWKYHINMTLTLDGKEIYDGLILGDGSRDWTKTPLELGVCKYGTDKILQATFAIDPKLTKEDLREESTLYFYWTFIGTKDQLTEPSESTEPSTSTTPSTSEGPATPSSSGELPRTGQRAGPGGSTGGGTSESGKRLPQTGEQIVYQFLSGLLLVLIALFLWRKRREEGQE
ncbi:LPXTG cell wall anchor domain-containing protein [Enterococcus sp. 669A]|uniref:LPXTG cell wall anchor domain-containing protein n=1 Tax=Candidatus Enterococcus moelleringii TaxID=2815325 RepID=A0ABS3LGP8_9ENTE|nr:LPXTG cell wall anchor domain-containing protein [Enterococcus sp. 669A]MBO1308803.1 LPXTG cell wall anchor domain-containing protein [Enterococcus sp. 669A]